MQGTEKGPVLFSTCPNCCLGGESRSFPLGSPHLLWPKSVALDPSIWSSVSGGAMSVIYPGGTTIDHCESKRAEDGEGIPKRVSPRSRARGRWPPTTTTYIFLGLMGPGHVSGGLARTICPKGGGRTHREGIPAPLSAAAAATVEEGESHYITGGAGKGTPEDREGGKKGKEGTSPRAR